MNPKAQLDTKRQKTFKDHFKDNNDYIYLP